MMWCTWYIDMCIYDSLSTCHTRYMHAHAFHICVCPIKSSNKTKTKHRSLKGNGSDEIQFLTSLTSMKKDKFLYTNK